MTDVDKILKISSVILCLICGACSLIHIILMVIIVVGSEAPQKLPLQICSLVAHGFGYLAVLFHIFAVYRNYIDILFAFPITGIIVIISEICLIISETVVNLEFDVFILFIYILASIVAYRLFLEYRYWFEGTKYRNPRGLVTRGVQYDKQTGE